MQIGSGVNTLMTAQRASSVGGATNAAYAGSSRAAAASASQAGAQGDGVQQLDFTNMSRQEMRDWVNQQVKSGAMSLDESAPFAAMTMKIPVGGGREVPAETDGERIDFTKRISDGIQGALSRQDEASLKMLQSALATVQKYQGHAVGIDAHV